MSQTSLSRRGSRPAHPLPCFVNRATLVEIALDGADHQRGAADYSLMVSMLVLPAWGFVATPAVIRAPTVPLAATAVCVDGGVLSNVQAWLPTIIVGIAVQQYAFKARRRPPPLDTSPLTLYTPLSARLLANEWHLRLPSLRTPRLTIITPHPAPRTALPHPAPRTHPCHAHPIASHPSTPPTSRRMASLSPRSNRPQASSLPTRRGRP